MTKGRIEAAAIDANQVQRLLAAQFPQWCDLAIERVRSAGTDNAIFRLGANMSVRLPRLAYAADQIVKEHQWLPLFSRLPLRVPALLGLGGPGDNFPWPWAVNDWIPGCNATADRLVDLAGVAAQLGAFVSELHAINPLGGPPAGPANRGRGLPLRARDRATREAIQVLASEMDVGAITTTWDRALGAAEYEGDPVWLHADLHEGNLLETDGYLSAVLDFGLMGVGDPAVDMAAAWTYLPAEVRDLFRQILAVDAGTWARGRAWALSIAVIALAYYLKTNPDLVARSRKTIAAVLADP
jgi:aminoglycoside phosphotransferase (APT) family kinase protein